MAKVYILGEKRKRGRKRREEGGKREKKEERESERGRGKLYCSRYVTKKEYGVRTKSIQILTVC